MLSSPLCLPITQELRSQLLIPYDGSDESYYLGPMGAEDPVDFINAETLRIPFKIANLNVADWAGSLRSWLTETKGWRNWYLRMVEAKGTVWESLEILHCIGLSVMDIQKNEPLIAVATYFWNDAMNSSCSVEGR